MKRILLLTALLVGGALQSQAQSWTDLFKNLFNRSEKKSEQQIEKSKYISAAALAATWVYAAPVIDYTGEDPVAAMAVSALEGQVEGIVAKAGIVSGRDKITFNSNRTAKVEIDQLSTMGNYRYTPSTGGITLSVELKEKLVSLEGETEYENGELTLRFKAEEVLSMVQTAAPKLAENDYVKIASSIIANYPGIRIGATFKRE